MNKLIIASAAAALMLGVSAPAFAQATPADCDNLFQRADVNKDGSLQADEAKVFIEAMNKAQVKPQDASMIKKDEFLAACQKNAFVDIKPETIGTASATQPATTTTATTEQPATTTQTTDQTQTGTAATTDQTQTGTAATTDQTQTGTAATTDQTQTGTAATTDQTQTTTTAENQPTTDQQSTTQPTEQALAAPEGFLASNIIGSTVYSQDDQSIGDINDIILSPQGQPSQVIVGVGGFLGMGEKDVVLDMSKLKIAATDSGKVKIIVQTTPEELKNMPAFSKKQ
jgi:ribosomal 30S subunit maturation factor RimM